VFKTGHSRLVALLGTAAVTASLIGVAVVGTGAYFTDTHPGQIAGTFGSVKVVVTGSGQGGADNLAFSFDGMMPGEFKTANISVQNTGTGNEDIYLVFDNANGVWSDVNTLGTFGEFIVNGTNYNNLNNHWPQNTANAYTNPCGDIFNFIRYLPHVNGLGMLTPGASATYVVQFRYSACISSPLAQSQPILGGLPLKFAIVAEQPGVLPNDVHNGAGMIPDLTLASGWYQ
jgi:hypothetical protein